MRVDMSLDVCIYQQVVLRSCTSVNGDQQVERGGAVLEIHPGTAVRGGHQAADLRDIAGGEEFDGPEHALVLPDHMGGTAPLRVGQCRGGQLSGCRITQEWDAERGRGGPVTGWRNAGTGPWPR